VAALDVDAARCERVTQNLDRLQVKAQVIVADAALPERWWDGKPFDAILLDAPCTASGIGRRHPDVRWLRRESDVEQLAAIQARLLKMLWPLLKPGGQLVYCTCSIFLAEGHRQIQTFLKHNTDAVLLPSPGHLIPQNNPVTPSVPDNQTGEHDGFYYALLQKRP
jgi:16S rRNA (cytosine967-C5)-methyltransferase